MLFSAADPPGQHSTELQDRSVPAGTTHRPDAEVDQESRVGRDRLRSLICCDCPSRNYEGIEADLQAHRQILNNARNMCTHLGRSRADKDLVTHELTSAAERATLIDRNPQGKLVQVPSVMNYVVWRRSSSLVLVGWLIVLCCLDVVEVYETIGDRSHFHDMSVFEVDYTAWKETHTAEFPDDACDEFEAPFNISLSSRDRHLSTAGRHALLADNRFTMPQLPHNTCYEVFARDFIKALVYKALYQGAAVYVYRAWVMLASRLAILALVARSAGLWSQWVKSRRLTYYAAVVLFLIPLLSSIVPGSLLIDWNAADADVAHFYQQTAGNSPTSFNVTSMIQGSRELMQGYCDEAPDKLEKKGEQVRTVLLANCLVSKPIAATIAWWYGISSWFKYPYCKNLHEGAKYTNKELATFLQKYMCFTE